MECRLVALFPAARRARLHRACRRGALRADPGGSALLQAPRLGREDLVLPLPLALARVLGAQGARPVRGACDLRPARVGELPLRRAPVPAARCQPCRGPHPPPPSDGNGPAFRRWYRVLNVTTLRTALRTRFNPRWGSLRSLFALAVLCALLPAAAAHADRHAAAAPTITAASASYNTAVLRWSARGADHYEFELAGDTGFNSLLLGSLGHFQTRSTIATINKTLPDGKYWWRIRAVGKSGSISPWVTRTFTKAWRSPPQLVSPADNASVSFPTQPLLLTWKPVLGAVTYEVTIAKDQALTTAISGSPAATTTTSYIPASTLADGKYFWAVTPLDAEHHEGQRSAVRSFTWGWPSATTTNLRDLVDAPELYDPLLTWNP